MLTYRNLLLKAIKNNELIIKPCEFSNYLEHIKYLNRLEKKSQSDSIIIFGDLKIPFHLLHGNDEIVLKISFENEKDNSLFLEGQIYEKIMMPLILNNNTPHILICIGVFYCENEYIDKNPEFRLAIQSLRTYPALNNRFQILVLEKGGGKTLSDCVADLTVEEYWGVLYQICYTLLCFQQIEFSQNDLHLGNIWIDPLLRKITKYYFETSKTKARVVKYNHFVKFFDFDFSIVKNDEVENTKFNERICKLGVCDKYQPKLDFFRCMYLLYTNSYVPSEIKEWIEQQINPDFLDVMHQLYITKKTFWGYLSIPKKEKYLLSPYLKQNCDFISTFVFPNDKIIKPLETVLDSFPIYQQFKNPKFSVANTYYTPKIKSVDISKLIE